MTAPQASFEERAREVIQCAFGGEHHVRKLKWMLAKDAILVSSFCEFAVPGYLSTWDYDELTKLVVAAHDQCVRAEVRPKGKDFLVILSDRERQNADHPYVNAHPTLEDHAARIREEITSEELRRRLSGPEAA